MTKKEEIREAVEIGKNEMEKLKHYLKDKEMELIHGERMRKMIKTLQTLTALAKVYLAISDDKLLPEEKEVKGRPIGYMDAEFECGKEAGFNTAIHEVKMRYLKNWINIEGNEEITHQNSFDYKDALHRFLLKQLMAKKEGK